MLLYDFLRTTFSIVTKLLGWKTVDVVWCAAQLYNQYGRELYIAVTNLTKLCSEYCHLTTTPDLPIRKAVRMSMSFPG